MPFDAKRDLDDKVYQVFMHGPLAWPLLVKTAVENGKNDVTWLTSVVFYLHHPERGGRKIDTSETAAIAEWTNWRTLIRPLVPKFSEPSYPGIEEYFKKFSDEPTLPVSKEKQLEQVLGDLQKLKWEGKLTDAQFRWASSVAKELHSAAFDATRYSNLAIDLLDIAGILPVSDMVVGVSGVTSFGVYFGVLRIAGPILQFVGFVFSLSEAMDVTIRIYRSVAVAYAITAWAFDDPRPARCTMVWDRITSGTSTRGADLDFAWLEAGIEAARKMNEVYRKLPSESSKETFKATLQMNGKEKLAKALVLLIADELPPKKHNESAALRDIARDLSYPK